MAAGTQNKLAAQLRSLELLVKQIEADVTTLDDHKKDILESSYGCVLKKFPVEIGSKLQLAYHTGYKVKEPEAALFAKMRVEKDLEYKIGEHKDLKGANYEDDQGVQYVKRTKGKMSPTVWETEFEPGQYLTSAEIQRGNAGRILTQTPNNIVISALLRRDTEGDVQLCIARFEEESVVDKWEEVYVLRGVLLQKNSKTVSYCSRAGNFWVQFDDKSRQVHQSYSDLVKENIDCKFEKFLYTRSCASNLMKHNDSDWLSKLTRLGYSLEHMGGNVWKLPERTGYSSDAANNWFTDSLFAALDNDTVILFGDNNDDKIRSPRDAGRYKKNGGQAAVVRNKLRAWDGTDGLLTGNWSLKVGGDLYKAFGIITTSSIGKVTKSSIEENKKSNDQDFAKLTAFVKNGGKVVVPWIKYKQLTGTDSANKAWTPFVNDIPNLGTGIGLNNVADTDALLGYFKYLKEQVARLSKEQVAADASAPIPATPAGSAATPSSSAALAHVPAEGAALADIVDEFHKKLREVGDLDKETPEKHVGGGGDCFYLSVAAYILGDSFLSNEADKDRLVLHLRNITALYVLGNSDNLSLDGMVTTAGVDRIEKPDCKELNDWALDNHPDGDEAWKVWEKNLATREKAWSLWANCIRNKGVWADHSDIGFLAKALEANIIVIYSDTTREPSQYPDDEDCASKIYVHSDRTTGTDGMHFKAYTRKTRTT